jgi:RHS repeat-associated protein
VNTPNSTINWFGQEYCYEYGFDSTSYTGNISGIKWKSGADGIARAYGMGYDRIDRLTYASFTQQQAGSNLWTNDKVDFSVTGLTYDVAGNILSMNQKGLNGLTIRTIDSLKYGYFANSNRLNYVTDRANDPASILGDFREQDNRETQDYWYDPNGNVAKDRNKSVDTVLYNHQQLPAILLAKNRKAAIHYLYAAGQHDLVAKMVSDTSVVPHLFRVTNYINGFQYEQDTLRFINQEEGRIRPIYQSGKPVQYTFDYYIKDNLRNVRLVLGTRRDTTIYRASMETATAARENALFSNIELTRSPKPVGYPEDETTDINTYVARLNAANGQKIGPALVLRVMAGDSIRIAVRAFLKDPGASKSSVNAEEMAAALLRALNGSAGKESKFSLMEKTPSAAGITGDIYTQLKEKDPAENLPDNPRAYLCFAGFNDQFHLIGHNAGVKQVQRATDVLQTLVSPSLRIQQSGYLYIYTTNESARDVYFDNLTVTRISSSLLEETHYYPFGLIMAGISSSALKENTYPVNKKRYNGIELNTDLELNEYDAFYRTLDPQTGRWKQIDPRVEKMEAWSPYASNFNNPLRYSDLLGDEPDPIKGFFKALGALANIIAVNISRLATDNRRENLTVVRNTVNKGIENFKGRIATGTTTPQLIYKELRENPLAAVTGLGGLELRGAAFAAEEFVATSKVANTGGKVAEGAEKGAKMSGKLDGAGRAAEYGGGWESGSLKEAVEKFAPGAEGMANAKGTKTIYTNTETGIRVLYDPNGNYFRIEDTKLTGDRKYLDLDGKVPNNKIVNGKQKGRNSDEYQQVTHFNNTDK